MTQVSEQGVPKHPRKKSVPWRRDGVILARMREVERMHFAGWANTQIADKLGVDEATIRNDLKRLQELWLERTSGDQTEIRARIVAELLQLRNRAISAAEFDEMCERAVLFGDTEETEGETPGRRVYRDDKGSASFRGQKASALNVARQATMDIAKVLGVVVDKVSPTDADGKTLPIEELMKRHVRARDSETDPSPG